MLFTFNDGLFERMYHGRAQVITLSLRKPTAQDAAATLCHSLRKWTQRQYRHICAIQGGKTRRQEANVQRKQEMTVFPRGVNQTIPNTRKKRMWYCTTPFRTYPPSLLTPGIQIFTGCITLQTQGCPRACHEGVGGEWRKTSTH
jgi:hypothetical protein